MIKGLVQGVGFRPFIYRLAGVHGLFGEVDNRISGVSVIVNGDEDKIKRFSEDILEKAPPASHIKSIEIISKQVNEYDRFTIAESKDADCQITEISPDIAVCSDCLADLSSDQGRINYPFINCTNCGPRFTIIEGLPYDRPKTTMNSFTMCERCNSEYNNILDRRFHAQPIACNNCGPEYLLKDPLNTITGSSLILQKVAFLINSGNIVAIKGIGGYFLMCDAMNNNAVSELRKRKHRDKKPFAVMFRDLASTRKYCFVNDTEKAELISWRRPIVILKQKIRLADEVNNGLDTTGAILPYMPYHYLLFTMFRTSAVVMTSGNLSEEPIIIDDDEANDRLIPVAGSIVSHNRTIYNRADDSVVRIINNGISLIRRSRGYVPEPVDLNMNVDGILALGPEQKSSFCIGIKSQAVMSQYIGDLKNKCTYDFYEESVSRFSDLYRFTPKYLVCDLHPDYFSTAYARTLSGDLGIPIIQVQHHHAHIASCMAENNLDRKVIGISMDGTGFGTDGKIWGGEFLVADTEKFIRYTHFEYVPMPGGEKAIPEPWRMAFSYLFKYFGESFDYNSIQAFRLIDHNNLSLTKEMIKKGINVPETSSAGRLFDAVSALTGVCTRSVFDSEAPMRLESVIGCETDLHYPFTLGKTVVFAEMFRDILNDLKNSDISLISAKFHNTLSEIILQVSEKIRNEYSINTVVLSGGVFQNKYLLERSTEKLFRSRFEVFTNHLVPSNDGGISLGQIVIASKKLGLCV